MLKKGLVKMLNKYDHLEVEKGKYDNWKSKGYFTSGDLSKKPYCIVIPPPNVTGKLHLGHAWDTTLQDIIIRYKKGMNLRLVHTLILLLVYLQKNWEFNLSLLYFVTVSITFNVNVSFDSLCSYT